MYADLHIHSWYSDGTYSPDEVVQQAINQNMSLISVCDHSTFASYPEIEDLCKANNIKAILGMEITSVMDDEEYHILAYGFDRQDTALLDLNMYNSDVYAEMGYGFITKMSADFPLLSLGEFKQYKRDLTYGGWDSIDYLRYKGLVTDFQNYVDFARKYAKPPKNDFKHPSEVINTIHNAGGYAVLAHLCHNIKPDTPDYVKQTKLFTEMGINGFECFYPAFPRDMADYMIKFCRTNNLMITAGSDDHGHFIGSPRDQYYIGAVRVGIGDLCLGGMC